MTKGYARTATVSAATLAAILAGGAMSPALAGTTPNPLPTSLPVSLPTSGPIPLPSLPSLPSLPLPGGGGGGGTGGGSPLPLPNSPVPVPLPVSPGSGGLPGGGGVPLGSTSHQGTAHKPAHHRVTKAATRHHHGAATQRHAKASVHPGAAASTFTPTMSVPVYNAGLSAEVRTAERAPVVSPAPATAPVHPTQQHPSALRSVLSSNPITVLDRHLPVGVVLIAGVALLTVAGAHGLAWVRRVAWA